MQNIEIYFILFITYSSLGWLMEVINNIVKTKKFVNRGFLLGPICPIYGWGALLVTILLTKFSYSPIALFVLSVVIASILEYLTSYFMEKLFHARWWDYSTKKFNLDGRICLETMIPFGLLSCVIIYITNPIFFKFINNLSNITINIISIILFIIFIIDNILTGNVMKNIRHDTKVLDKDNTEEMHEKVIQALKEKSWFNKRLFNAFPSVRHIGIRINEDIQEIVKGEEPEDIKAAKIKATKQLDELKQLYELKSKNINDKLNKKIIKIKKNNK